MSARNASANSRENLTDKGIDKDKEKDKGFIAVRWPSTLRKALKVAAAGSDPPLTMTEYLAECFNEIQGEGGLSSKKQRGSMPQAAMLRHSDKEQRKRYQEVSERLFKTHDRRLIDLVISLLAYVTR